MRKLVGLGAVVFMAVLSQPSLFGGRLPGKPECKINCGGENGTVCGVVYEAVCSSPGADNGLCLTTTDRSDCCVHCTDYEDGGITRRYCNQCSVG